MIKYISKAPLRLGLAGGGTDVSPYSENHGGAILNATINRYASVVIIPRTDKKVIFNQLNKTTKKCFPAEAYLNPHREGLQLQIGVYNRIIKDFDKTPLNGCEIITELDVATGSGLGTSSTIVVALVGAFVNWLKLPLGEYDIAQLAVSIEREDLQMLGGKQDQYAATFGGVNFMEFGKNGNVIVNPLRIKSDLLLDLEHHLLLFYTQTLRASSNIIAKQRVRIEEASETALHATHELKKQAFEMKATILKGNLSKVGAILQKSWEHKKNLAQGITTPFLDEIYQTAQQQGATGGKISGAGGGGFMMFYCPKDSRLNIIEALKKKGVAHCIYRFEKKGLQTWTSKE